MRQIKSVAKNYIYWQSKQRRMASMAPALTQYLIALHHYEMLAEHLRAKIARNPYFQHETLFQRIDKFGKGYLVPDDLAEFMLQNQLYPSENQLYLIFRDFDSERAGVITLQQLTKHLLPKEDAALNQQALKRRYYPPGPRLEIDLQFQVAKYFEHKLKEVKELASFRIGFLGKMSSMVDQAFGFLDCRRTGYLSSLQEIDQFLRSNGKVFSQPELSRIFRVLSFDSPHVTFEAFSEQIDPFAKGYYIGYSQRVAQKYWLQQEYLRDRLQLNSSLARNSRERVLLQGEISALRQSNERLGLVVEEQERERRERLQQLVRYKHRRNQA